MIKIYRTTVLFFALLPGISSAENLASRSPADALAFEIAQAHGWDNWAEVSAIEFQFNVDLGEQKVSRRWSWDVTAQEVTALPENVTLSVKNPAEEHEDWHSKFINDSYWLVFPFHLIWDIGTELTMSDAFEAAPISGDPLRRLTITYVGDGGYTPGDAYDLFVDEEAVIREWTFRKGNAPEPTRSTTWENYERLGGLLLSTEHNDGTENGFRLWFTDLRVSTR
ncbi:MAG: hypothetical protein ACFCU3_03925 [Verrucomicrobiales bacterium]